MTSFLFDIETRPHDADYIKTIMPPFDKDKAAALDPRTSKVLCITYKEDRGDHIEVDDSSETELLGRFWSRVRYAMKKGSKMTGYNILPFDVPYVANRTMIASEASIIPDGILKDDKWLHPVFRDVLARWRFGRWKGETGAATGGLHWFSKLFGSPGKSEENGKFLWQIYDTDRVRAHQYCLSEMQALELVAIKLGCWQRTDPWE
jgi:hypothetical protein